MAVVLVAGNVPMVSADTVVMPDIIITEVQTGNDTAGQEFVELYNVTDVDIDLADANGTLKQTWKLQYFSSSKVAGPTFGWSTTAPSGTISLTGVIPAHDFYLLGSTGYAPGSTDADQVYSPHLANDGGGVRLVTVNTTTKAITGHDQLGWLTVVAGAVLPTSFMAPHPQHGSWQREMNDEGSYVDEANVVVSFQPTTEITPKAAWQVEIPVAPEPEETPPSVPDEIPSSDTPADIPPNELGDQSEQPEIPPTESEELPTLLSPQITELLPKPASPQTDDIDEFVELFNPNDQALPLDNYSLETGTNNSYHAALTHLVLPAHGYLVVTSGDSSLSLANAGGHARLKDATGAIVSQSDEYSDAPEGSTWALILGVWQWTTTSTPRAANILTLPPAPIAKVVSTKVATTKPKAKTVIAKVTKPKVLSASTTPKKTSTKAPTKSASAAAKDAKPAETIPPVHTSILAAAGVLAVGYAVYEYRQDIANRIHQFRRYRAARRAARSGTQGR